ncbi:uncharacterized protein K452DRAFT_318841 [Aplosporella prunicola CBS 121167]|uniref:Uncharacterized protein n=1 Tax=Aplosporella prunicola CBS 121167 TaxID=1176127 RepID=A0A6A6BFB6_9PEZI|nr:uncharacterized protein K452DRAFT_318841 [Aplosporella prunicola CBS 121167]KAF2141171.1 hypothetical protein K452DRAFT_318841 [Aplosporella prunicola CBS 121167]
MALERATPKDPAMAVNQHEVGLRPETPQESDPDQVSLLNQPEESNDHKPQMSGQSAEIQHREADLDTSSKKPGLVSLVCTRWLMEVLACVIALLALVAIIITLGLHDGRPIPDWPFRISVNAVVSIFSVILKGTMLVPVAEAVSQLKWSWYKEPRPLDDFARFDDASRGIWGSARLITRLRGMHLASLGAAIMILAAASDPFIQQVIKYQPCSQKVSSAQATMPRTNNYTAYGAHVGAGLYTIDAPMEKALYKGFYDSFSPVTPTCTTGNCTFPNYRTVGVCSMCRDISDTINTTCKASKSVEGGQACSWELSSSLRLNNSAPVTLVAESRHAMTNPRGLTSSRILTFTKILDYNTEHLGNLLQGESGLLAAECFLIPCVRTYSAEVVQGQTSEKLLAIEEMAKMNTSTTPYNSFFRTPMPCIKDNQLYNATAFTERNETNWIPVKGLLENNQTAYLPKECIFIWENSIGILENLPEYLTGYVQSAPIIDKADPQWMKELFNKDNASLETINATWSAIAESMTIHIRQNGDESNSAPAAGIASHTNTCINVRWPWLAYPAALLVLTFSFLLATILHSFGHVGHRIWKASQLAVLFHGLDDALREKCGVVDRTDQMASTARGLHVQVKHEETGMRFVEAFPREK